MPLGRCVWVLFLFLLVGSKCTALDNTIAWAFPGYELTFHTRPQDSPDSSLMPLLAGRLKPAHAAQNGVFGIVLGQDYGAGKAPSGSWVYELYDVRAGRVIERMSVDDVFGKIHRPDCRLVTDEKLSIGGTSTLKTTYEVRKDAYVLGLTRSVSLIPDEGLPTGRRLVTVFEIRNNGIRPLSLRFSQRALARGVVAAHDSSTVFVRGGPHDGTGKSPIIVLHADAPGGTAATEPSSPENVHPAFRIRGATVSIPPAESRKVMGLVCAGTTAEDSTQALRQATNIAAYLSGAPPKPDLAVSTTADSTHVVPGQTVTYTVVYTNVGTSPIKDVIITNPIPAGVSYLENSAGGEGTVVDIGSNSAQAAPGAIGAADCVTWKIGRDVLPGDQGRVFFSAVVR